MKPPDPALEALWKNVLDHWELDAAHLAFLEHCRSHDALDHAAARYGGMKGDRDRGTAAEKRLRAVLLLAMAKLELSRAEPKAASGMAGKLALIAFFVLGSLLLLTFLMRS